MYNTTLKGMCFEVVNHLLTMYNVRKERMNEFGEVKNVELMCEKEKILSQEVFLYIVRHTYSILHLRPHVLLHFLE